MGTTQTQKGSGTSMDPWGTPRGMMAEKDKLEIKTVLDEKDMDRCKGLWRKEKLSKYIRRYLEPNLNLWSFKLLSWCVSYFFHFSPAPLLISQTNSHIPPLTSSGLVLFGRVFLSYLRIKFCDLGLLSNRHLTLSCRDLALRPGLSGWVLCWWCCRGQGCRGHSAEDKRLVVSDRHSPAIS